MGTILLIILVIVLVGAIPRWPHSRRWGYGPSGLVGLILVVVVILLLLGRIGFKRGRRINKGISSAVLAVGL